MLFSCIKAEFIKLKRSPIWVTFFILPILAAVMGTFNYTQNLEILTKGWYSLWTQQTLFACFFFLPALIGAISAYSWRMEHRDNNWNSYLCYPVHRISLLVGKLISVSTMIILLQLITLVLFVVSGLLAGIREPLPSEIPSWILMGGLAAVAVASVQLFLSMVIKNFALPIGFSLLGGILGIAVASAGYSLFWPYSLLSAGMNANGRGDLAGQNLLFIIMCILFTSIPLGLSLLRLKRLDIH